MAPQGEIPVAANVLGTIGTILWCVQLVPQIWTNWRNKKTDGLPGTMMFLWALCGVPFGVYAIVQNFNIPIQLQAQIFMALALVSWSQILIYNNKWKIWKAASLGLAVAAVFACVEVALILTLRPLYNGGNETPVLVVGISAAVLLAAGLVPPYWEIWKRKGRVIGISWVFLTMDWLGAFFSLMALVAQETFDTLGGVLYIIVCTLEAGIFFSHIVFLARTRKIRKEAATEGKTFDDLIAEHETQGIPFKFAEWKSPKERDRRREREASELPRIGTEDCERAEGGGSVAALSSGSESETLEPEPAAPVPSDKEGAGEADSDALSPVEHTVIDSPDKKKT